MSEEHPVDNVTDFQKEIIVAKQIIRRHIFNELAKQKGISTDLANVNLDIDITQLLDTVVDILIQKNLAYGDSARNPVRIFSDLLPKEGIAIRIDDKLSRIKQVGLGVVGEDTFLDLIGYLIILYAELRKERVW